MPTYKFLEGGGEMGALTRSFNWSGTSLGTPDTWPQSLKTTLSIILNSKFPMFLWWGPKLLCFYNDAYRPSLGKEGKHPGILGQPANEAWSEIWEYIKPLIDQVLTGGEATWSEDQMLPIYRNGKLEDVYWTFSYSPVSDESGNIAGVFVTCTETTAKLSAIKDIQNSKEDLDFALNAADLGTWDLDPATNKFKGNARLKEWFGLAPDAEIPLPLAMSVMAEKDKARVAAAIEKALQFESGGNYDIEYTIINPKTNKERLVRAVGKALFNDDHIASRFSGTLQDITREHTSRKAFEDTFQRLEIALDAGKLGSYDLDLKTGIMICSDQCKLNYGQNLDAPFNFPDLMRVIDPDYRDYVQDQVNTAIAQRSVYNAEYPVSWPDGSRHWISVSGQPRYNETGEIASMIGVTEDITEIKQYQRELQASEQKLDQIISQLPAPIVLLSGPNQVIETTNESLLRFWNKTKEQVRGKPMLEVFPELKNQPFPGQWKHVFETGEPITNREKPVLFNLPEGGQRLVYVDYYYQPLSDPNGIRTGVLATVIDVTDKVESRTMLEKSQANLRMAIDTARIGTWSADLATDMLTISEHAETIHGVDPGHSITLAQSLRMITADYREQVSKAIQEAIKTGKSFEVEYTIAPMDQSGLRWLRSTGKAYYDDKGRAINIGGTIYDVTESKQDEQRKNDFIGIVSHELKTPLTSLKGYTQILNAKAKKQQDEFAIGALGKVETQINKMSTMINSFLNVSRLESGKIHLDKEEFDLYELVNETVAETMLISPSHHIILTPVEPIIVFADRDKIEHVISNLLSNAIKYSPRGTEINVTCALTGTIASVNVQDKGMGIKPHDAERLFERYYRVESNESKHISGFGIGLYLSSEIIQRHGGKIAVDSEFDKGSTFYFTLPLNSDPA
jgi:PAS domain S-box-containing protein